MNPATVLSLCRRDLDAAKTLSGPERRALIDRCASRLLALPAAVQAPRQAELLLDVAIAYYVAGDRIDAAVAPMAKAIQLFVAEDDLAALRRCRSIQCLLLTDCANYADAIQSGSEALRLSCLLEDSPAEVAAWSNLCIAFFHAGLTREARACGERALQKCQQTQITDGVASTLHVLAMCAAREHDFRAALDLSRRAVEHAHYHPHFSDIVLGLSEWHAALCCLYLQDVHSARPHLSRALHLAQRSGSERLRVPAEVAQGLLEVIDGLRDAGLDRIRACVQAARTLQRENLVIALATLVEAYERLNDPQNALAALRDLLDLCRRTSVQAADVRDRYSHLVDTALPIDTAFAPADPWPLDHLAARCRALLARSPASLMHRA